MRVDSDEVDNFDRAWFEGNCKDGWDYPRELGPAYLPSGVRGPHIGEAAAAFMRALKVRFSSLFGSDRKMP
jgi:hypothetical protein